MAELRCNTCKHYDSGFCVKLKEGLPNVLTKLFYGGAVSLYSGDLTYPGECGIEKEREAEMGMLVSENFSQEMLTVRTTLNNSSK